MDVADVAVIGAGPAGAVAACLLARAGVSVALLDPRAAGSFPRKPGDALAGAALRVLRACGLPPPSPHAGHRPIGGNISVWGTRAPIHRDFMAEPDGPGWRVDRDAFERDLVAAGRDAGVRVQPRAVRSVERDSGRWLVHLQDGGRVAARWLIDATGRAAAVARRLGAVRHRDEPLVAVVGYGRPDARFTLERSLVETVPDGWWYTALLPDRRPVFMLHGGPAAARLRGAPEEWSAALRATEHVARAFPEAVLEGNLLCHEACGAWLDPVYGDGWVACGDAALSFDPCAAQGMFSALHSGMVVADAVLAALRAELGGLRDYSRRCAEIRRIYRPRVRAAYAAERRWPDSAFWRAHTGEGVAMPAT